MAGNGATATLKRVERPYQAVWQFDAACGLGVVTSQLGDWLRSKGIDVDLSRSDTHRDGDRRLTVVHHKSAEGRDVLARLQETNDAGAWTSELTATAGSEGTGWLHLRVKSGSGHYVKTPRLVRYLLSSASFVDGGSLELTPGPRIINERAVEELAEVLTDVDRQGLAFVAGASGDMPFDPWVRQVGEWSNDVAGLAEVFVLDPAATGALMEILGPEYGARPWSIRTYRPGLDPAVPDQGRLHRFLTTERLALSTDQGIRYLLGRIARGHAAERELPPELVRARRAISRTESTLGLTALRDAAVPSEPPPSIPGAAVTAPRPQASTPAPPVQSVATEVEQYVRQVELVKRLLGIDALTEERLRPFMSGLQPSAEVTEFLAVVQEDHEDRLARIEELEDRESEMKRALDDAQIELDIEVEARSRAESEVRWLRKRLADLHDHDGAYAPVPQEEEPDYPDSFASLIRRLLAGQLTGVVFTGDPDMTETLDEHDALDTAVRVAWQACLALSDYAACRESGWKGGVERFLRETPAGRNTLPPNKHAATESESVTNNSAWKRERLLPVPVGVDKSGKAYMLSHFKLGLVGSVSPRLYYLDDVAKTGKVYIGYIGRHLTNTKTR